MVDSFRFSILILRRLARSRLRAATTLCIALATVCTCQTAFAAFADGTGIAIIPGSGLGWGIALQTDGKVIAAGPCGTTYCVARLNTDGTLDATFGASPNPTPGRVAIPGLIYRTAATTVRVLVRTDGKIVLGGTCSETSSIIVPDRFCVARLNANGTLDNTFIGPNAAAGNGSFIVPISASSNDQLRGMAIEAINNQKLILVGECGFYHCVARLNDDGTFDQTFTGPGANVSVVGIDPPSPSAGRDVFSHLVSNGKGVARGVVTQPNGKIIIVGGCYFEGAGEIRVCMTKLNEDGTLDTDFNGTGTTPGVNPGRIVVTATDLNGFAIPERGIEVVMQPDGDFLVLCDHGFTAAHCVYRFNSGGTLETNFSSGLPFPSVPSRTVFGAAGRPWAMALTPSGSSVNNRLLTIGQCSIQSNSNAVGFCVGALVNQSGGTADGTVDVSLTGPNGDGLGSFKYEAWASNGLFTGVGPRGIVAQSDGSFFVVSTCSNEMCVYKFRADGALDTSPCVADVTGDGNVSAASDGRAIFRSMLAAPGAPALAAGTGYDIDASGSVAATSDGLLIARRMLGFSGDALLAGITFAINARRSTAPEIESYLRKRCGIPNL